jgi:hypothetical protein
LVDARAEKDGAAHGKGRCMTEDAALPSAQILLVDDDETFREVHHRYAPICGMHRPSSAGQSVGLGNPGGERICLSQTLPDRVNGLALGRTGRMRQLALRVVYVSWHDSRGPEE